jgi:hypothetical protein
MKNKVELSEITPETIAGWKAQFVDVYTIEVAIDPEQFEANTITPDLDDMPKLVGYLRKPDRKCMNFALVTMPKNLISAGKAVVKECWLGGDERILTEDAYFSAAAFQAIELVEIYQARLKKV